LERVKVLDKLGVGIDPFTDAFLVLEEDAKNGDDEKVQEGIAKLAKLLDAQDERRKEAQGFVPDKGVKNHILPSSLPANPQPSTDPDDIVNYDPTIAKNVLSDHKRWMAYYKLRFSNQGHKPEDYPNYLHLVDFFGRTLRAGGRANEAAIYEQEAAAIRTRK